MLIDLGVDLKWTDPVQVYKYLWTIRGNRSATARGMFLSTLSAKAKEEVMSSYTAPKADVES